MKKPKAVSRESLSRSFNKLFVTTVELKLDRDELLKACKIALASMKRNGLPSTIEAQEYLEDAIALAEAKP